MFQKSCCEIMISSNKKIKDLWNPGGTAKNDAVMDTDMQYPLWTINYRAAQSFRTGCVTFPEGGCSVCRGTTHWKKILLVKEDPNVTVSKEQRREMRLVVEVSFQHGSQEGGEKKKPRRAPREWGADSSPLKGESEKTEPCGPSVVLELPWSLPQEMAPRVPGRRNVIVPVGFQSFRDAIHFICTTLPNHPPKIHNDKSRTFSALFQLIWVKTNYKLELRGRLNIWSSGIKWPSTKQVN